MFNIEIIYEIIEHNPSPNTENNESRQESPVAEEKDFSLKPSEIDFLPIVKEEAKPLVAYKFEKKEDDEVSQPELLEIKTIFEILEQIDSTDISNEQEDKEAPVQTKIDFSVNSSILDFHLLISPAK